jgi:O-antigen/teichoic acid export membrane protein
MFFSAELIIISLLGEKWRQSILFFQILIFLTISFPLRTIVFKAILSLGYSSVKLKLGLINNVIKLLSIPIGYFFGIEAFAWMVVVGRFLIVIVTWYFFQKLVQFKLHKIFTLAMVPVLVLFFWTIVYLLDIVKVNMLLYLPAFIITYFLLIKMTNNLGYVYFKRELLSFINKRK